MYWPSPHQANVHCVQIIFLLYAKCIPTYIIRLQIISSRHNRICINVGSIQTTFLSLFVWDPIPIIALPCPSAPESLLIVKLDCCGPWRSRNLSKSHLTSHCPTFCQTKPIAEVWSKFWSCSFRQDFKAEVLSTADDVDEISFDTTYHLQGGGHIKKNF